MKKTSVSNSCTVDCFGGLTVAASILLVFILLAQWV